MAGTILQLGWTDPLTGAFGSHPALGAVLDLNDGVSFTLASPDALELEPPERTLVTAGNIRAQGERATRGVYQHNRQFVARVILGPMASYADLAANVRALVAWVSAPPAIPITLQYQPEGAAAPVYLDVVGAGHSIPSDEGDWLRLQLAPVELVFVVRPGLRGDRVTLSNLVANPGFEAPMGGAIGPMAQSAPTVFVDTLANANAYTSLFGSAPTVSGNVLTVPSGAAVSFGSPAWGALNSWTFRFQWATGLLLVADLHRSDSNNRLAVQIDTNLYVSHVVGGVSHNLGPQPVALTNGNWYWLGIAQFPSPPGDPPLVWALLFNDAGGAVGSLITTCGPVAAYDAVTALVGRPGFEAVGAALKVGGAYSNVCYVKAFGPGGWGFTGSNGGSTGAASGAWDGTRGELGMSGTATAGTQTYGGGPVSSFGSARLDFAPAGTANAYWETYSGGSPSGTSAVPVSAAGDTLAAAVQIKSSGLAPGSAQILLQLREWDASGALLRATTLQSLSGNQPNWTKLSGSVVTGVNCAYASVLVQVVDATSGSANGSVWVDNVQCWNVTRSGNGGGSSMPYCELRFPNSPAQLMVSGLLGDLPAPVFLALGTYLANWPAGATLSFALGRRAQISANAQLVGTSNGFYGTAFSPQATAALDATSYGGYYAQAQVTSAGWNPRAFSSHPADAPGTYHLFERHLSQQSALNLPNVQVRVVAQQLSDAWYGNPNGTDQLGAYAGAWSTPLASSNAWTVVDAGQVVIPPLGAGALTDLTQTYVTPRPQWTDATGGGAIQEASWQMLLPVDGSLLMGALNNPSNAPFAVASQWVWSYVDALAVASGGVAAWTYSLEAAPLPIAAHAGGGPGTQSTGAININAGADPYLKLDPSQQLAGNGGVNQLVAYIADGAAAVLPVAAEIQYAPLYLWPR